MRTLIHRLTFVVIAAFIAACGGDDSPPPPVATCPNYQPTIGAAHQGLVNAMNVCCSAVQATVVTYPVTTFPAPVPPGAPVPPPTTTVTATAPTGSYNTCYNDVTQALLQYQTALTSTGQPALNDPSGCYTNDVYQTIYSMGSACAANLSQQQQMVAYTSLYTGYNEYLVAYPQVQGMVQPYAPAPPTNTAPVPPPSPVVVQPVPPPPVAPPGTPVVVQQPPANQVVEMPPRAALGFIDNTSN